MPRQEVFELHPAGWESDPPDEYFKLSTLDYCVAQVYNSYALFFKLTDEEKPKTIPVLRRGLEVTLSQCRQLCGVLEDHPDSKGLCFHKKRESTVQFHVQWLDGPEDEGRYPSFDDLERRHFVSQSLGDIDTWCVPPMTYGEKPEAEPASHPKAAAFKATFIRGGMVFMMHHHHYANDVMGWSGELHQLAENCAAIWRSQATPDPVDDLDQHCAVPLPSGQPCTRPLTCKCHGLAAKRAVPGRSAPLDQLLAAYDEKKPASFPPWDPACLDLSRVTAPDPPQDQLVEGPVPPLRHPDHRPNAWLLFHLPASRAAALKRLASPPDGSMISTYDAATAFLWRHLTRRRAALFGADPAAPLLWGEAVDMRRRLRDPPGPARMQGNVVAVALSTQASLPPLTVGEVAGSAPLWRLASYIRSLTNGVSEESLVKALEAVARVRDKTALFLRTDSFPPLSNFTTDWRDARPCEAEFGFGTPYAFRFPFGTVTPGLTVVYPPRKNGAPGGEDEGSEFCVAVEKEIMDLLVEDEEWGSFFEFRGIDAEDAS